jgi:sorbitol-specific phosphotransferase system component IIBC
MADLLADLTTLMTALSLTTADVKRGPLTDERDAGDETALIDYAGSLPEITYCGPQTRLPRVAVQARRSTAPLARARVESIYVAFIGVKEQTAGNTIFNEIIPQGEPFWLDEDRNGRTVYACNFEVARMYTGSGWTA